MNSGLFYFKSDKFAYVKILYILTPLAFFICWKSFCKGLAPSGCLRQPWQKNFQQIFCNQAEVRINVRLTRACIQSRRELNFPGFPSTGQVSKWSHSGRSALLPEDQACLNHNKTRTFQKVIYLRVPVCHRNWCDSSFLWSGLRSKDRYLCLWELLCEWIHGCFHMHLSDREKKDHNRKPGNEYFPFHLYLPSFCERHQCVMKPVHWPFAI